MFNKHLLKVILGFCGMILLGLTSLVIFDSYRSPEPKQSPINDESSLAQTNQKSQQKQGEKSVNSSSQKKQ